MKLNDLLNNIPIQAASCDLTAEVAGITLDSRRCKPGYVFCAVVGAESGVPGIRYAQKAVENGAVCVLCDTDCPADLPFVRVADAELALAEVSANFYGHPAEKLRLIGVTGTNGKTTTTHLVRDILTHAGKKCGLIGTNELMIGDQVITSHPVFSTTPEPPELHALFAQMVEAGCEFAVMEVSSHSLVMGRVEGVEFDNAVFTNLTEDHLDYHKTMDNYAKAKAILFEKVSSAGQTKGNKAAWVNVDDPYAHVMMDAVDQKVADLHTYSMSDKTADLYAFDSRFTGKSSAFKVTYEGKTYQFETRLAGRFNIYNTLGAIGAALSEGISMETIAAAMKTFHSVPGRFELIDEGQSFTVVVDYAHTPDGLEKILTTAQEITKGRILVVFGCGGDRDKMKRPIMGRIAARYADVAIVTSDNPRTEDPETIVKEVAAGVEEVKAEKPSLQVEVVVDRRSAIQKAISLAKGDDIVLIAGKGHEDYQILKDKTIHFDDREEARKALKQSARF